MCRHECSVGTCLHTWLYVTKVKAGDLWSSRGNYCHTGHMDSASDSKEVSVARSTKLLCKLEELGRPFNSNTPLFHAPTPLNPTATSTPLMGCQFTMTHTQIDSDSGTTAPLAHCCTKDLRPHKHKAVSLYRPTHTSQ